MSNYDDHNNGARRCNLGLGPGGRSAAEIEGYYIEQRRRDWEKAQINDLNKRIAAAKMPIAVDTTPSQNETKSGNGGAFVFFGILAAFGWMLSGHNSKTDPEAVVASPVTDTRSVAAPLSSGEFNCMARGEAISLTFSFHHVKQADGQPVRYPRVAHPTKPNVINLEAIANKSKSCAQAYSTLFKHYPKP